MIIRIPPRKKSSSISSTLASKASRPSRRVMVAHSINRVINSALLIILGLDTVSLSNTGNFLMSESGNATNSVAAVPTKIMTKAAGFETKLSIGAPFRNIPKISATKPRISPIIVEISIAHLVLEIIVSIFLSPASLLETLQPWPKNGLSFLSTEFPFFLRCFFRYNENTVCIRL
ncbi:hypothetical protein D1872_253410 [compost metagenome]